MVYVTQDECKSALGKKMQRMRTDRPDEWTMDELIRDSEAMAEAIRQRDVANQELINKYKLLAKERGDFILNGEELGYIRTPTCETDKAYLIFMRCKLTDEKALQTI